MSGPSSQSWAGMVRDGQLVPLLWYRMVRYYHSRYYAHYVGYDERKGHKDNYKKSQQTPAKIYLLGKMSKIWKHSDIF